MMVTTHSAIERLQVNDIEVLDDENNSSSDNCNKNAKSIDYMPNFKDISWSINEFE